jgi:hypothetical protein
MRWRSRYTAVLRDFEGSSSGNGISQEDTESKCRRSVLYMEGVYLSPASRTFIACIKALCLIKNCSWSSYPYSSMNFWMRGMPESCSDWDWRILVAKFAYLLVRKRKGTADGHSSQPYFFACFGCFTVSLTTWVRSAMVFWFVGLATGSLISMTSSWGRFGFGPWFYWFRFIYNELISFPILQMNWVSI